MSQVFMPSFILMRGGKKRGLCILEVNGNISAQSALESEGYVFIVAGVKRPSLLCPNAPV